MDIPDQFKRWRLILGPSVQDQMAKSCPGGTMQLSRAEDEMDLALAAIYDESEHDNPGTRTAGLGPSAPRLGKWLGDIRAHFSEDVVTVIQADAIERKGLARLLFEPETLKNVQPNIGLVTTLMSLKNQIPERTKDAAREVVRKVVEELISKMENELRRAVTGALNRKAHSPIPNVPAIDWKRTIERNLKNFERKRRILIPERFFFFSRRHMQKAWNVIIAMDQSGSMATSVVYGSICGAIFASIPALSTRVVVFDTEVVDLTETCGNDPVDMLFGVQLGGGTDIHKAVQYCAQFITDPRKTLFILISDLIEGGNQSGLIRTMKEIKESGVRTIALLALSDDGQPFFDERLARTFSSYGIPSFACTPKLLPDLVAGALRGHDLMALGEQIKRRAQKR